MCSMKCILCKGELWEIELVRRNRGLCFRCVATPGSVQEKVELARGLNPELVQEADKFFSAEGDLDGRNL